MIKKILIAAFLLLLPSNFASANEFVEYPQKYDVSEKKRFTINFNKKIDKSTINLNNVYVLNECGIEYPVKVYLTSNKKGIVVQPKYKWIQGKEYTLYIKDIKSSSGKKLNENMNMKFTTKKVIYIAK